MATEEPEASCKSSDISDEEQKIEENLVVYLQNILKHQIVPMNFMNLRKLVKEAPQHLKLYPYIQEKYPAQEFTLFLQKFPTIFTVNPDNSVQIQGPSFCIQPSNTRPQANCDEVDGLDRGEYESDSDSE